MLMGVVLEIVDKCKLGGEVFLGGVFERRGSRGKCEIVCFLIFVMHYRRIIAFVQVRLFPRMMFCIRQ